MKKLAITLGLLLTAAPALADFRTGWTAYEAGEFDVAARAWLQPAELGDAQAQHALGILLLYGRGLAADSTDAAALLAPAAAAGHAEAAYALATLYQDGDGVERDLIEAARLYTIAAMTGHASAMNNLGIMLVLGQGSAPDAASAHTWFGIAARLGDLGAARNRDRTAAQLSPAELAASERAIAAWRAAPRPATSLPLNPAETYPGALNAIAHVARALGIPEPTTATPAVEAVDMVAVTAPVGIPAAEAVTAPAPVAELTLPPNLVVVRNLAPPEAAPPEFVIPPNIVVLPTAATGAPIQIVPRR
jgi:hypothetical protein